MGAHWGLLWVPVLCSLLHAGAADRDFDLADALDDLEPTKKPGSDFHPQPHPPKPPHPARPDDGGNIYPRPRPRPPAPQPGYPDSGGSLSGGDDGRYPPRPRPPAGGGGGGYPPGDGGYGNTHGGGRPRSNSHGRTSGGGSHGTYGSSQDNLVAKIVSPIVSVVVVTLAGAAVRYFQHNRRTCFRPHAPENV